MLANDMKKGTVVRMLGTNWRATIMDNKKGLIRDCDVEGLYREIGSCYVHDMAYIEREDGTREAIELTPAQAKQAEGIKGF
jgi:hypothetical protein